MFNHWALLERCSYLAFPSFMTKSHANPPTPRFSLKPGWAGQVENEVVLAPYGLETSYLLETHATYDMIPGTSADIVRFSQFLKMSFLKSAGIQWVGTVHGRQSQKNEWLTEHLSKDILQHTGHRMRYYWSWNKIVKSQKLVEQGTSWSKVQALTFQ